VARNGMVMTVNVRSSLVAGGLVGLLALGAVACEVENGEPINDPLEEDVEELSSADRRIREETVAGQTMPRNPAVVPLQVAWERTAKELCG
jgi:hypothetical protein